MSGVAAKAASTPAKTIVNSAGPRTFFGLYEPIHGSAPDIAGRGIANPIGAILSAAMMLRYSLGEHQAADAIEAAVDEVLRKGRLTPDLAESPERSCSTQELGDLIAAAVATAQV